MFEVAASSSEVVNKGTINVQIMNQTTNKPESSINYTLTANADPSWVHQDKTDKIGKIQLTNIPTGQYTLKLSDPELSIVPVESN